MERMKYMLRHYSKIFSEGSDVLKGWMQCIREEGHIVMPLEDNDLKNRSRVRHQSFEGGMRIFVQGNVNSSL